MAYTYDPILFFFICRSTTAKTGALGRGLIQGSSWGAQGTSEMMRGHSRNYVGLGIPGSSRHIWGWALQGSSRVGHSGFSERCAGRARRDWASESGLAQNLTTPHRRWETKRMHKQGLKFERRKVVLDAEGFERTMASLIVNRIFGFVACVCLTHESAAEHMCAQACGTAYAHLCTYNFMCTRLCFRARVRASMCSGIHSSVHHVHMRVFPSTCARKHV